MEDISMRGAVVRISQDSMEAYLTLQPPEAGEGYTLSELVRYIRTQRVTNGIDEAAIQEMIDGGVYMRDVCIAKGQPPVNAENGRYELHFNPDVDGKPKVKEDGSIDYWSIRTVEMVKEGKRDECFGKADTGSPWQAIAATPRKRISLYRRRKYLYCRPVWKD